MTGRREAERFVEGRLSDANETDALQMLAALATSFSGLALATLAVARAQNPDSEKAVGWRASGTAWLQNELRVRMAEMVDVSIDALGPVPNLFLHTWAAIDEPAAKKWVRDQVNSGRWCVLDLAASTIGTGFSGSGAVMGDFEPSKLAYWYPLDEAIEKLRPAFHNIDERDLWDARPTDANKRLAVLQTLKKMADARVVATDEQSN